MKGELLFSFIEIYKNDTNLLIQNPFSFFFFLTIYAVNSIQCFPSRWSVKLGEADQDLKANFFPFYNVEGFLI